MPVTKRTFNRLFFKAGIVGLFGLRDMVAEGTSARGRTDCYPGARRPRHMQARASPRDCTFAQTSAPQSPDAGACQDEDARESCGHDRRRFGGVDARNGNERIRAHGASGNRDVCSRDKGSRHSGGSQVDRALLVHKSAKGSAALHGDVSGTDVENDVACIHTAEDYARTGERDATGDVEDERVVRCTRVQNFEASRTEVDGSNVVFIDGARTRDYRRTDDIAFIRGSGTRDRGRYRVNAGQRRQGFARGGRDRGRRNAVAGVWAKLDVPDDRAGRERQEPTLRRSIRFLEDAVLPLTKIDRCLGKAIRRRRKGRQGQCDAGEKSATRKTVPVASTRPAGDQRRNSEVGSHGP